MKLPILLGLLLISCTNINRDKQVNKEDLTGSDYRLFQDTPAWELAKAVQDEDEKKINEIILKEPKLVNYQEPKYGNTLLKLTIMNQQLTAFKILLNNKADINIHDTYDGTSALIEACSFKQYDIKFAEMLLQGGAHVNDIETGKRRQGNGTRLTPLIAASKSGKLGMVKLLIKSGADVNYQNEFKQTALSNATLVDKYNIVLYLLQNGADYKLPIVHLEDGNKDIYLADVMRTVCFDLDSDEYKDKMAVVDFLRIKSIEYKNVPIPDFITKEAKEHHPNSWQEYLDKY